MNNITVLDCTLRDGGYCNQWKFGTKNIIKIIYGLTEARVDIIECGFLSNNIESSSEITKFRTVDEMSRYLLLRDTSVLYVGMINYGEYDIQSIPSYKKGLINGIRIAFHKEDMENALKWCDEIKKKGYMVFIQPMVSLSYSDEEFLRLIKNCNEVNPFAFYIVDSFGVMKKKDLVRLFYMVENNLSSHISIGFHTHNNMQLAYSNAQALTDIQTKRNLIIDCSIFGMGRGAGNLNTELFMEYLNDYMESDYKIQPLLKVIDEVINHFYQINYWGYSLPNYLSATHKCHPNYALFLDDKKTLTIEDMNNIFVMMDEDMKNNFSKQCIQELYDLYMNRDSLTGNIDKFKNIIKNKKILVIGPGKSAKDEVEKVIEYAKKDEFISICVNFDYPFYKTDYIFVSNLRRFKELPYLEYNRIIITSNIQDKNAYLQIKYSDLTNNIDAVHDNAGLMLVKFLINCEISNIYLAGFDGYSYDATENYVDEAMNFSTRNVVLNAMNVGMSNILNEYSKLVDITYITNNKYIQLET